MNINLALNKIALHILLDNSVISGENEFIKNMDKSLLDDSLIQSAELSINGERFQINVTIDRISLDNSEDLYSMDVTVFKGRNAVVNSISSLSMPHTERGIREVLSVSSIGDFISLFETSDDNSFYSVTHEYDDAIINYALSLNKGKNKHLID